MDIKAIVLVAGRPAVNGGAPAECIGEIPIAYLDVLGIPILERVLQRLQHFGVSSTTLITDAPASAEPFLRRSTLRPDMPRIEASGEQVWQAAEEAFDKYAEGNADLVLVLRVGSYAEIDYEEFIQHHLDHRCAVTQAVDADGASLDLFALNAVPGKNAATLFRSGLQKLRRECEPFRVTGYVNRLQNSADLRLLAVDGLLEKNAIRPVVREVKPGVWVADSARIHPKARIVAPAFIGARSKIRASALITRASVIEHHAQVDCGTVVENSTVLPYTYVGPGLDVVHSVLGFRRIYSLVRKTEVEIADDKLVGMAAVNPISRLAGSTAALFAFLPTQICRGLFASSQRKHAADIPESLEPAETVLQNPVMEAQATGPEASEFPSTLAVVRRYGDQ